MFTGLVQAKGRIAGLKPIAGNVQLRIDTMGWQPPVKLSQGDSVCVSGTCLTLVDFNERELIFDVIAQTMKLTKLGKLRVGAMVNLESCLTPQSQLGGHFVQGHVDGVGTVRRVKNDATEWRLTVVPPRELLDYLTPQGSVTIDGVSLTLARVGDDDFDVALIPTTLNLTTLAELQPGDAVNLETDIIAKTIVHWLRRQQQGGGTTGKLTLDMLHRAGY